MTFKLIFVNLRDWIIIEKTWLTEMINELLKFNSSKNNKLTKVWNYSKFENWESRLESWESVFYSIYFVREDCWSDSSKI